MQDIKPATKKIKPQKTPPENRNFGNDLVKKVIISVLILFFIGIIIFYFIQEKNGAGSKTIKINNEESKKIEVLNKETASENLTEETGPSEENIVTEKETSEINPEINNESLDNTYKISSSEAEKIIKQKSETAINAFKNKNFATVANLMSSDQKLVFSPYANFSESDQSFTQDEIKNILNDSTKYTWGKYNGIISDLIKLSFSDYYNNFIYDQDYANAEIISYNKDISSGKIKNNSQSFFENSITVEYHFSGFDPELKEKNMDWRSLRLVFVEINDEWYLKGISHDELTI